jgi:putative oxidoreductase
VEGSIAQQRARPIAIVRVAVAALLGIHGFTRAITVFEMVASILLALGLLTRWVPLGFVCILTAGIATVHGREGWFVVGGGRNGVEFSVLLISCLLAILYDAWRPRPAA